MLLIAAILTIAIGLSHSYLGERYILTRLFRRSVPKILGSEAFTKTTLRFAWHITTIAWMGFAVVLLMIHFREVSRTNLLIIIGVTFAASAITSLLASRGRHYSWIVFGAISTICFVSASAT